VLSQFSHNDQSSQSNNTDVDYCFAFVHERHYLEETRLNLKKEMEEIELAYRQKKKEIEEVELKIKDIDAKLGTKINIDKTQENIQHEESPGTTKKKTLFSRNYDENEDF
jgi:predicted  nucleic acid-binding Zn-ribbon protein